MQTKTNTLLYLKFELESFVLDIRSKRFTTQSQKCKDMSARILYCVINYLNMFACIFLTKYLYKVLQRTLFKEIELDVITSEI